MGSHDQPSYGLEEERRQKYQREITEKIDAMLSSGMSVSDVARLLAAEEFLTIEQGKHRSPVFHFRAADFARAEARKGAALLLPDAVLRRPGVTLPPGEGEVVTGRGTGIEKKEIIHRGRAVVEALSGMTLRYRLGEGAMTKDMMRTFGYQDFYIPSIQKLILANDEEGNATFVVHNVPDEEEKIVHILTRTKEDLRSAAASGMVSVLEFPKGGGSAEEKMRRWQQDLQEILSMPMGRAASEDAGPPLAGKETVFSLSRRLRNMRRGAIENFLQEQAPAHGHAFPDAPKAKGRPAYIAPELVALVEAEDAERQPAPPGWKTRRSAADSLGISTEKLDEVAYPYRAPHPEWFQKYIYEAGKRTEHFAPELLELLRQGLEREEPAEEAPPDWHTVPAAAALLDCSPELVKKDMGTYAGPADPAQQEYKVRGQGQTAPHMHPLVFAYLLELKKKRDERRAPERWHTAGDVARELSPQFSIPITANRVREMATAYAAGHAGSYAPFWSRRAEREDAHMSPETIEEITRQYKEIQETPEAPPDWYNEYSLFRAIVREGYKISRSFIGKLVAPYRGTDQMRVFRTPNLRLLEHYSPEVLALVRRELSLREDAPPAWLRLNPVLQRLSQKSGRSLQHVRDTAKSLSEGHGGDWIKKYKRAKDNSQLDDFCDPRLAEELEQLF